MGIAAPAAGSVHTHLCVRIFSICNSQFSLNSVTGEMQIAVEMATNGSLKIRRRHKKQHLRFMFRVRDVLRERGNNRRKEGGEKEGLMMGV